MHDVQLHWTYGHPLQGTKEQAELERMASDRASLVAAANQHTRRPAAAECAGPTAGAAATGKGGSWGILTLSGLSAVQLDKFFLGAVDHPSNNANL